MRGGAGAQPRKCSDPQRKLPAIRCSRPTNAKLPLAVRCDKLSAMYGERLPAVPARRHARQQDVHGAFAAGAEAEELVRGAAQVVADDARLAGGRHVARVFAQVTFETSAGQAARRIRRRGDEHLRAGFGIGGAAGPDDRGEYQGLIGQARAVVQREEAVQATCGAQIYASLRALRLARDGSNQ